MKGPLLFLPVIMLLILFSRCGFATYLFSMLIFIFSIRHGAHFMFLTGSMLGLAAFSYGIIVQNDPPLQIPFQDGVLKPTFNYSFYLTAVTGGVTMIAACVILLVDWLWPRKIAHFFHHSLVHDDNVFQVSSLRNPTPYPGSYPGSTVTKTGSQLR